jgi:hypothetical protein
MTDEWTKRLQLGISEIREQEARRTVLVKRRAEALRKTCFGLLGDLVTQANTTLRSSNLTLNLQRSAYSPLSAWIEIEMCVLDTHGRAGEVYSSIRVLTSTDNMAQMDSECANLPPIDLDRLDVAELQEMIYEFAMFCVKTRFETPKQTFPEYAGS